MFGVECHHDCKERVIYVHLTSVADPATLRNVCLSAASGTSVMDHVNSAEVNRARALLFIFSVAHIIVVNHPSTSFDMEWVRLFHVLDAARLKAQPEVSTLLTSSAVSKEWANTGRPCSPRVLFVFETTLLDAESLGDSGLTRTRSQKTPAHKRLQHSLEDQIYRILRKARIITNISNNSLFAVPANQEFVFVFNKKTEIEKKDPLMFYMSHLEENSVTDGTRGRTYSSSRKSTPTSDNSNQLVLNPVKEQGGFKTFLWQHTHLALAKGFDDNVGRNPIPAHFELPTAKAWLNVANKLWKFFLLSEDVKNSWASPLHSLVEIDVRFSEARCSKVLPLAESAYQEGLPSHYTTSYHLTKLVQAKRIFNQHARGPACGKYLEQLEEDCEKIWKSGRQLCEETSLTGNHCVNELHRLPETPETEDNKHLPEMNHSSQVKTKAVCNCGRKQTERDDPFTHKAANFEFYDKLEVSCCAPLDRFKFPLFQPSTPEAKAAAVPTQKPGVSLRKDVSKADLVQGMSGLSLALSLGQSGASGNMYDNDSQSNLQGSQSHFQDEHDESPASQVNGQEAEEIVKDTEDTASSSITSPIRQHSTTEYLPSMIHTESVPGLVPTFPSWALVCLGKYSSYNPSHGVDQPGFLHCCNFLLPWEVGIHGDKDKWPSIDMSSKKSRRKGPKDGGELSVTVYLGHEYECPRGHRFFISAPDKIFKAPATGQFKENAYKLINQDTPLYFPCQCRNSKGSIAQLMRVHVVVPEGPLRVELKPFVQPGAAPCPLFHPGSDGPLVLPSAGHWVLRFPYIYVGDKGPYFMPSDPQQFLACRVMKGLYHFQEISA